jgi:hypothetical protein
MPPPNESQRVHQLIEQLNTAVTNPAFLQALRDVGKLPEEQRLKEAQKRLTPKALAAAGVSIPDNLRISSRYFEDPQKKVRASLELGATGTRPTHLRPVNVCASIGSIVCVSIGADF